jgi:hypothetical protein
MSSIHEEGLLSKVIEGKPPVDLDGKYPSRGLPSSTQE